jgi:uncharacterized protein (DUF1778 family)
MVMLIVRLIMATDARHAQLNIRLASDLKEVIDESAESLGQSLS